MALAEVLELMEVGYGPAVPAPDALAAIARVRALLDDREVALTRLLAAAGADPESTLMRAGRVGLREASKITDRALTVDAFPELGEALATGAVSGPHIDAVAAVWRGLEPAARERLATRDHVLTRIARDSTPAALARSTREEAARLATTDDTEAKLERQRRATALHTWTDTTTGMWCGRFQFDPATAIELDAAITGRLNALFTDKTPDTCPTDPLGKQAHLRGLALADLVLHGGSGSRVDIALVFDLDHRDTDGEQTPRVDLGLPISLPVSAIRQLCANATINPIVIRDGTVVGGVGQLNLGRTARLANRAQRRALRVLYPTCAIPGCDTPYSCTKPHHVIWWRNGGPTDLDNLLPLCSTHHHRVHDDGWQLKLLPDRTLVVTHPDGTVMRTGPPRNRTG